MHAPPLLVSAVFLYTVFVMRYPRSADSFATSEQARIRAHLNSAELGIPRGAGDGLDALAARCSRSGARPVHEYGCAASSRKTLISRTSASRTPLTGRHPVRHGYLIEESGHGAFVARIAATNNNARIWAIKDDPELISWLGENGLRVEEGARVQPEYNTDQRLLSCQQWIQDCHRLSVGANLIAGGLSVAPLKGSRTLTGVLGITTGLAGMAIGFPKFGSRGDRGNFLAQPPRGVQEGTLGFWNAGVGAVAAAVGVYRLSRNRSIATPVSFAPWVSTDGASGLSGRITF